MQLIARFLVVVAAAVAVVAIAEPAFAHAPDCRGKGRAALERCQAGAVAHARGASRFLERVRATRRLSIAERRLLRFHRRMVGWAGRELAETRRASSSSSSGSWRSSWASWYGPGLYGNGLACGGVLEAGSMVVAHKTIACGTRLEVCWAGRCARAYVGDRGPFVAGRELDLGPGVAAVLGFAGVAVVRWRIL